VDVDGKLRSHLELRAVAADEIGKARHLVVAIYDLLSGKIATAEADVAP
jgi:hypothetical protein